VVPFSASTASSASVQVLNRIMAHPLLRPSEPVITWGSGGKEMCRSRRRWVDFQCRPIMQDKPHPHAAYPLPHPTATAIASDPSRTWQLLITPYCENRVWTASVVASKGI
jgi:hypothetical protein